MALKQLSDGGPDGTKLGQSTTDLLGFYGVAPVTQPAVLSALTTAASVATFGWGFASSEQAATTIAAINGVISRLKTIGLMATA